MINFNTALITEFQFKILIKCYRCWLYSIFSLYLHWRIFKDIHDNIFHWRFVSNRVSRHSAESQLQWKDLDRESSFLLLISAVSWKKEVYSIRKFLRVTARWHLCAAFLHLEFSVMTFTVCKVHFFYKSCFADHHLIITVIQWINQVSIL